jgi:hypothetical protein
MRILLLLLCYAPQLSQAASLDASFFASAKPSAKKDLALPYAPQPQGHVEYHNEVSNAEGQIPMEVRLFQHLKLTPISSKEDSQRIQASVENLKLRIEFPSGNMKQFEKNYELSKKTQFVFVLKSGHLVDIENIADAQKEALKSSKSVEEGNFYLQALSKEALLSSGGVPSAEGCQETLAGKKPGAKWKAKISSANFSVELRCRFSGWVENFMLVEADIVEKESSFKQKGAPSMRMKAKGKLRALLSDSESWNELRMENSTIMKGLKTPQKSKIVTRFRHYPL